MSVVVEALMPALVINVVYALPVMLGWLDNAPTEDGPDHYAEKPLTIISHLLPDLPMPLNTVVNLGYIMVALVSMRDLTKLLKHGQIRVNDCYSGLVFCWLSFLYGPVQLGRILTQDHRWAIADQWVTLPIFSWVVSWTLTTIYPWSGVRVLVISGLSISSYTLTLLSSVGFELALTVHILLALSAGVILLLRFPSPGASTAFTRALLFCAGFVFLKLLDLHLPKVHFIFNIISGHFLSKIADFMQIYYVVQFFGFVLKEKYKAMNSEKKH